MWQAQIVWRGTGYSGTNGLGGDHLFPIWMVRDDWRVGGRGTISVQGGLLVARTDGPGGQVILAPMVRGDHLFPIWMVRGDHW